MRWSAPRDVDYWNDVTVHPEKDKRKERGSKEQRHESVKVIKTFQMRQRDNGSAKGLSKPEKGGREVEIHQEVDKARTGCDCARRRAWTSE